MCPCASVLFRQSQNCLAVGTQAALLAGFAYSGLTQVAIPLDSEYVLKLLYLLVTTTAMCLELIAVMNTTLLSMMGPGLALRGPDGSMHPAVDGMIVEYQYAYVNFVLGLIFFHFGQTLSVTTFSAKRTVERQERIKSMLEQGPLHGSFRTALQGRSGIE